jgi:hypothetical protein
MRSTHRARAFDNVRMRLSRLLSQPIYRWLTTERPLKGYPLSDFDRIRDELQACDVVLVEGRSRASDVIKLITQSHWSHAALYIGRMKDIEEPELQRLVRSHMQADSYESLIVESELGIGTVIRPLSVYRHEHLRICRPRGLNRRDAILVLTHALGRVGNVYDVRQILDLARFLFPWAIMPRRWRSTLFNHRPGQETRSVCSTMIADAFDAAKFPILPLVKRVDGVTVHLFRRNPQLCTPSDFDYSPYFEIIKYPFLDLTTHSSFCLVPWQSEPVAITDGLELSRSQVGVYLPDREATADGQRPVEQRSDSGSS